MTLYQRIYACRDLKTAKRAWYVAGIFEWPIMAFMGVLLGMFARVAAEQGMFAELGFETERSNYSFDAQPMHIPVKFLVFKGDDKNNRIEWYYLITGKETDLSDEGGFNRLLLSKFIGLYDETWHEIIRIHKKSEFNVDTNREQWNDSFVIDMDTIHVPAGNYHYEIQVEDLVSKKLAVYKDVLSVADYRQEKLMLSDILLSGAIEPAGGSGRFNKSGLYYQPHMFQDYTVTEPVGVYFECYNLSVDDSGQTDFQVSCTLQPEDDNSSGNAITGFFKSLFSADQGEVTTAYRYRGNRRDDKIYINFDVSNYQSGHYALVIEVTDMSAELSTSKSVELVIE
jgi:hypothetical protein